MERGSLWTASWAWRHVSLWCWAFVISNDCRVVRPAAVEEQGQHICMAFPGSPKGWRLPNRILLVHIRAAV
jgi:hypothetical protein